MLTRSDLRVTVNQNGMAFFHDPQGNLRRVVFPSGEEEFWFCQRCYLRIYSGGERYGLQEARQPPDHVSLWGTR